MAQGDSWADPIIIGENAATAAEVWADFMSKKESGSGKYMRFKDIHTTISGTGTVSDPYQVSTYHEMLTATGATYIWQCKLIDYDEESPTAIRKYMYGTGDNAIYCDFDPSLSTIDFNGIYESYTSTIVTTNHIDVNGWTWLNLRVTGMYGIFRCGTYYTDQTSMNHLILLNCQVTATDGNFFLFCGAINDSIMQVDVTKSDNGGLYWFGSGDSNYGSTRYFYRCSLKLKIVAPNATVYGGAHSADAMYSENCMFDFDIEANAFGADLYGFYARTAIVKGKVKASTVGTYFGSMTDCILDITDAEGTPINRPVSSVRCVYNKDKVNWSDTTGLTGVTSAQLLSPTALQAAGLSIGVDVSE